MQLERVTDEAALEAIYRLRVAAWRARVPGFPDIAKWTDGFDAEALHWAIFENGAPVAAARLTVHDGLADACDPGIYRAYLTAKTRGPIGILSRLVVSQAWSGRGLPRRFDSVRLDFARRLGCACVLADAHPATRRIEALCEAGFEILGPSGPTISPAFAAGRAARGFGDMALVKWLTPEAGPGPRACV